MKCEKEKYGGGSTGTVLDTLNSYGRLTFAAHFPAVSAVITELLWSFKTIDQVILVEVLLCYNSEVALNKCSLHCITELTCQ